MLTIEHGAAAMTARALASGAPRITPVHDPVDKRHSDLAFNIDTGGRPSYRVLIARDRSLFAADQAGARNASNFYDSQREGLLHYDGPPGFYLVPRSVLHAMLPAPRLYYTLIAYADAAGSQAVYAHAPESLATQAPFVTLGSDLTGTLGLMFGTPVHRLMRVEGTSLAWQQADEEVGEDFEADTPETIGLAADDGDREDDDGSAQAAAYDADDTPAYGDDGIDHAAAADDGYDDGYVDPVAAAALGADDDLRMPALEGSEAAAAFEDDGGWNETRESETTVSQSLADDYDDGFGGTPPEAAGFGAQAYEEQGEDYGPEGSAQAAGYGASYGADDGSGGGGGYGPDYGDEHEGAQSYGAEAYDAPPRQPVPEMLPDEDADGVHAAQAGEHDEDEVDIEPSSHAQAYDADSYGSEAYDAPPSAPRRPFDIEACKAILGRIMPFESGSEGYARVVEDGEFAGRYGSAHPAYNRYHLGLTFGAFPFVQEHGTLGQLLALMRERDRATFDAGFPGADELIAVTTHPDGPHAWDTPDGLSPRLRPVGGKLLWQEPWVGRFKRAGQHLPFQGAQNELAARLYIQPVLTAAKQIGLDSEQGLTLLVDRAVQMGPQAALAWVLEAATPVETPALKQRALAALGHADLQAFQAAQHLPVSGTWDPATHAALIAALRAAPNSPSPVLGCNEIVGAMLRHAQGTPWAERLRRLRDASSAERLYQL